MAICNAQIDVLGGGGEIEGDKRVIKGVYDYDQV